MAVKSALMGPGREKLPNPRRNIFLKLAAESVRAVNAQRDEKVSILRGRQ